MKFDTVRNMRDVGFKNAMNANKYPVKLSAWYWDLAMKFSFRTLNLVKKYN